MQHLFCFGLSYTASHLINLLENFKITATKRKYVNSENIRVIKFDEIENLPDDITHILISIPPVKDSDIVYEKWHNQILKLSNLKWIGYLSSTSVYGNHQGEWVNEYSLLKPLNQTAFIRSKIEEKWLTLHTNYNIPINVFRIAGIYGLGRNPIERIIRGEQLQIIEAPKKYFSRIHVEDLARILKISMNNPTRGEIYNVADDLPIENSKVIRYTYDLLKIQPDKAIMFEDAVISPMLKDFYISNKKVSNNKIKNFIKSELIYPNYKIGLSKILKSIKLY